VSVGRREATSERDPTSTELKSNKTKTKQPPEIKNEELNKLKSFDAAAPRCSLRLL